MEVRVCERCMKVTQKKRCLQCRKVTVAAFLEQTVTVPRVGAYTTELVKYHLDHGKLREVSTEVLNT